MSKFEYRDCYLSKLHNNLWLRFRYYFNRISAPAKKPWFRLDFEVTGNLNRIGFSSHGDYIFCIPESSAYNYDDRIWHFKPSSRYASDKIPPLSLSPLEIYQNLEFIFLTNKNGFVSNSKWQRWTLWQSDLISSLWGSLLKVKIAWNLN